MKFNIFNFWTYSTKPARVEAQMANPKPNLANMKPNPTNPRSQLGKIPTCQADPTPCQAQLHARQVEPEIRHSDPLSLQTSIWKGYRLELHKSLSINQHNWVKIFGINISENFWIYKKFRIFEPAQR